MALNLTSLEQAVARVSTKLQSLKSVRNTRDVGTIIREARKAKKLSQQNLADFAGVGRRFVSELEAGKPSLEFEKVIKVSSALGLLIFAAPASAFTNPAPPNE